MAKPSEIEDLKTLASAVKEETIESAEYYVLLEALISKYRLWKRGHETLRRYCDWMKLKAGLKPAELVAEVHELAGILRSELATTEYQRQVLHSVMVLGLCCRAADMDLEPPQFEALTTHRPSLGLLVTFACESAAKEGVDVNAVDLAAVVECAIENLEFYRMSVGRTTTIAQGTLEVMEARDEVTAVLITSGFLGNYVKKRLHLLGATVVEVLPKVDEPTDKDKFRRVILYKAGLEEEPLENSRE